MVCTDNPSRIEIEERRGRFREEVNYEVSIVLGNIRQRLAVIKVFNGRPPYYRRWIEVFAITRELYIDNNSRASFKNSIYEEWILDCVSSQLGPGESLFIETIYDEETEKLIEKGAPPPLTRLGYKLLERGFTWFKAWYYPEGFMEGSTKIQAVKPLSDELASRNLLEICNEVRDYIGPFKSKAETCVEPYQQAVIERANSLLSKYCLPRGI